MVVSQVRNLQTSRGPPFSGAKMWVSGRVHVYTYLPSSPILSFKDRHFPKVWRPKIIIPSACGSSKRPGLGLSRWICYSTTRRKAKVSPKFIPWRKMPMVFGKSKVPAGLGKKICTKHFVYKKIYQTCGCFLQLQICIYIYIYIYIYTYIYIYICILGFKKCEVRNSKLLAWFQGEEFHHLAPWQQQKVCWDLVFVPADLGWSWIPFFGGEERGWWKWNWVSRKSTVFFVSKNSSKAFRTYGKLFTPVVPDHCKRFLGKTSHATDPPWN